MTMNFNLTEEQTLLADTVDKFVRKQYSFEQRRSYQADTSGWSRDIWNTLAEVGVLGLPFSAEQGGLDGGPVERMLAMEAFGRALLVEPYIASAIVAGSILRQTNSLAAIESLISGNTVTVLAAQERSSRYSFQNVRCVAEAKDGGYVLTGEKVLVSHGDSANTIIVTARIQSYLREADGISLFLLPANADNLIRRGYRTQDGQRVADLQFFGVHVDGSALLGPAGGALPLLEQARDEAIAALAAEGVGVMQAAFDLTVDYLKQREQFGGPIGRFQALQHRAAEMLVELEQARSMAYLAAAVLDEPDLQERRKQLSAVKVQLSRSGRFIGEQAIQLHGGIGVTEEYAVAHYYARLMMMDLQFGDATFHLNRFIALGGLTV